MADTPGPARLRVSNRSIVVAVALFGLMLGTLALIAASARVLGWLVVAAAVAGILHPAVRVLSRRMPRGIAIGVVFLGTLALAGGIGYAVVDDVTEQLDDLERVAPREAREVERSETFGEVARELRLAERVETFVEQLPERLRGGDVQESLRSAATRGVAFLATAVLTLFFLIHGRKMLVSAIRQLPRHRREEVWDVAMAAYRRTWTYIAGSLAMAVGAGLLAYVAALIAGVPSPAPLAVWMAMFDLVPLVGVVIGAAPLVLLAATTTSVEATVAIAVVLLAWQVFEAIELQNRIEARSLHLGPYLTVAVGAVGIELYGIGGAVVALGATILVAAVADEVVKLRDGRSQAPSVVSEG